MNFNDKLKAIRARNGWTQQKAADTLGVKLATYLVWEHGRGKPKTDNLVEVAKVLGVTVDVLLDNDKTLPDAHIDQSEGFAGDRKSVV